METKNTKTNAENLTMTIVKLKQAEHGLNCHTHLEPIETVAARCNLTVAVAQTRREKQSLEAACIGRTIPNLTERANYWKNEIARLEKQIAND